MDISLQALGSATGWLLCGGVLVRTCSNLISASAATTLQRKRYTKEKHEFQQLVTQAAGAARASQSTYSAWQGLRDFRVAAVMGETRDTKSFYLTPADNRALPRFEPGQFLTFSLDIPGREKPLVRCYSLSDRARDDFYRVTIKRAPAPKNNEAIPPGLSSNYFHDQLKTGDILKVSAPRGDFFLDPRCEEPLVLIGGGIGITPVLSMLNTLIHRRSTQPIYFFLGVKNRREHPFRNHLEQIAAEYENVHLHISYSNPTQWDTQGRDFQHAGRITLDRLQEVLPSNNFDYYLCGPGPMMGSLVPGLDAWGVPESHIHFEAFGPASIKRAGAKNKTTEPCDVKFATSEKTVLWDGSHESLLEMAEAAGLNMESGCRAGNCGQCLTAIRSGKIREQKKPGLEVDEGYCLTCISSPDGPLILDA